MYVHVSQHVSSYMFHVDLLFVPYVSLQLKELRSRVADMEGQSRSSAGVSQLENKIQELEERLRSEERYCSSSQRHFRYEISTITTYPKRKS